MASGVLSFSSFLQDPVSQFCSFLGQGRGQKQAGWWQDLSKCPWDLESLFWTHLRQSDASFIPVNFISVAGRQKWLKLACLCL